MIFVSHGKQIISADSGGLLKIWDLNTKECIKTTEAHYDKIWALVASEDESKFVTGPVIYIIFSSFLYLHY